jgi:hypothetical protein
VATHLFQIPIGSFKQFSVQHVSVKWGHFFVIVGFHLWSCPEALHSIQVDIGGGPPIPTSLCWMFSCQYIFVYFQGHFGALNIVFLAFHSQTIDKVIF